jgi:uncharacterized protein (TIGR02594 family)
MRNLNTGVSTSPGIETLAPRDTHKDLVIPRFPMGLPAKKKVTRPLPEARAKETNHVFELRLQNVDGEPLRLVECELHFNKGGVRRCRTDGYGLLYIDGLPESDLVTVRFPEIQERLEDPKGDQHPPANWIRQRLLCHDGKTPFAEQPVELIAPSGAIVECKTNEDGEFLVAVQEAGEYEIRIPEVAQDGGNEAVDLDSASQAERHPLCGDDEILCGVILDEDGLTPLSQEAIEILEFSEGLTTDDDGYFEFPSVEKGEYEIVVRGHRIVIPSHDAPMAYPIPLPADSQTNHPTKSNAASTGPARAEAPEGTATRKQLEWDAYTYHQYSYRNLPGDYLTNRARTKKRRDPYGGHYWSNSYFRIAPMKDWPVAEQEAEVKKWKDWRAEHGDFDEHCGQDACGPTSLAMVLNYWGQPIDCHALIEAKHTLIYYHSKLPEGADGKRWIRVKNKWGLNAPLVPSHGKKYPFYAMDSANPYRLTLLAERFLHDGDDKDSFEWTGKYGDWSRHSSTKFDYEWNMGGGKKKFSSDAKAFRWLEKKIDAGVPVIISYKNGPCKKTGLPLRKQGSSGHYVVVIGYDEESIVIADPSCGAVEVVPKGKTIVKGIDVGFGAAWGRKKYRYLVIEPKKDSGMAKEPVALVVPTVEATKNSPPPAKRGATKTLEAGYSGLKIWQYYLSELHPKNGKSRAYYDLHKKTKSGRRLTIDGQWGPSTTGAVRRFQADHGLKVTGKLNTITKAKLKTVWAKHLQRHSAAATVAAPPEAGQPSFVHGRWSCGVAKMGSQVDICIETTGMPNGTPVTVEVWEKDRFSSDDRLWTLEGKTKDSLVELDLLLDRCDSGFPEGKTNEFYFVAIAGDVKHRFKTVLKVHIYEFAAADTGKPPWLAAAEREMGVTENLHKKKHNKRVLQYHAACKSALKTDEYAWCAAFANWCFKQAGITATETAKAIDFADWGKSIDKAAYGALAVVDYGNGSGHVGFVVGKKGKRLQILGGNQGGKGAKKGRPAIPGRVKVSGYLPSKISHFIVPADYKVPDAAFELTDMGYGAENDGGFANTR